MPKLYSVILVGSRVTHAGPTPGGGTHTYSCQLAQSVPTVHIVTALGHNITALTRTLDYHSHTLCAVTPPLGIFIPPPVPP